MSYNVCTGWTLFFVSALGLAGMSYLQIDLGTLFQFGLKTLLILGFLTFIIQYIVLPLLKRLKTKSTLRQDAQEPEPENVQKLKQARKTVQEKYSLELHIQGMDAVTRVTASHPASVVNQEMEYSSTKARNGRLSTCDFRAWLQHFDDDSGSRFFSQRAPFCHNLQFNVHVNFESLDDCKRNTNLVCDIGKCLRLVGGGGGDGDELVENTKSANTISGTRQFGLNTTFETFEEFQEAFEKWARAGSHSMRIKDSRKMKPFCESTPYSYCTYICKRYGHPRVRSKLIRPNQRYIACNCQVVVGIHLNSDGIYQVFKFFDQHNHEHNEETFRKLSQPKVNDEDKETIKRLFQVGFEAKDIKKMIGKTGVHVTSKDLSNLKKKFLTEELQGRTQGQLLLEEMQFFLEQYPGCCFHMDTEDGGLDFLFIQTPEMQETFREFPENIFLEATYRLNSEGYPLYTIFVQDQDTVVRPVVYCFLRSETTHIIEKFFNYFCETNNCTSVKVVMVKKDFSEINSIKKCLPNARILMNTFHVIHYLKNKVKREDGLTADQKHQIMNVIRQLIYSQTEIDYTFKYAELTALLPVRFREYFDSIWHECREQWAYYFRKDLINIGRMSNSAKGIDFHYQKLRCCSDDKNRFARSVRKLSILLNKWYTSEALSRFKEERIRTNNQFMDQVFHDMGQFINPEGQEVLRTEIQTCLDHSYDFHKSRNGLTVVCGIDGEYSISTDICQCTCSFYKTHFLPCQHILAYRKEHGKSIVDKDCIPKQWKREPSKLEECRPTPMKRKLLRLEEIESPSKKNATIHLKDDACTSHKTDKRDMTRQGHVMSEHQKYKTAINFLTDFAEYLSTCEQSEFNRKMNFLKSIHEKWMRNDPSSDWKNSAANDGWEYQQLPIGESIEIEVHLTNSHSVKVPVDILLDDHSYSSNDRVYEAQEACDAGAIQLDDKSKEVSTGANFNKDDLAKLASRHDGTYGAVGTYGPLFRLAVRKRKITDIKDDSCRNFKPVSTVSKIEEDDVVPSSEENGVQTSSGNDEIWMKKKEFTLKKSAKELILQGKALTDEIIDAAQTCMKEQFRIKGFQSTVFKSNPGNFTVERDGMVQILFQGNNNFGHWVVASTLNCRPKTVAYYDTLMKNISSDVLQQLCAILKPEDPVLKVRHMPVQKQVGMADCGLLAIANALAICTGLDPSNVLFDQSKLRGHLINCFETGHFSMFPHTPHKKKMTPSIIDFKLFCVCRCLDDGTKMLACDSCGEWFHLSCIDVDQKIVTNEALKYYCDKCKGRYSNVKCKGEISE